jgi:hypothetical protein
MRANTGGALIMTGAKALWLELKRASAVAPATACDGSGDPWRLAARITATGADEIAALAPDWRGVGAANVFAPCLAG